MSLSWRALLTTGALVVAAVSPAAAQIAPMGTVPPKTQTPPGQVRPKAPPPAGKPAPDALAPNNPDFKPEVLVTQTPTPPLPPAVWDIINAQDLLRYIQAIGKEGLNPADYDPEALAEAIQSGNIAAVSAVATDRFDRLSSDLAFGHVKKPARIDWWVADPDLSPARQDALMRSALAAHAVTGSLDGLLPTHPQYAALKAALAQTPESDEAKRDRIRLNLDRWRWLPRDLGEKYIIVNVPGFHATLVENGVNRWKERAIAGKL